MTQQLVTVTLLSAFIAGIIAFVILEGTVWGQQWTRSVSHVKQHRMHDGWGQETAEGLLLRLKVERIRTEKLSDDTRELRAVKVAVW